MHAEHYLYSHALSDRIIYINSLQTEFKANRNTIVLREMFPIFGKQVPEATLCDSFSWDGSPEGYDFWNNIWEQIRDYAHKFNKNV